MSANCGDNNVAFGYQAALILTGSDNVFIGTSAGVKATSGGVNLLIGSSAGGEITTGNNNIILGYFAW